MTERQPYCVADLTDQESVWCLLAAVLSHEAAHTAVNTERQALKAELEQLRRCQAAGHLLPTDGWRAASHLAKVEARLRKSARVASMTS